MPWASDLTTVEDSGLSSASTLCPPRSLAIRPLISVGVVTFSPIDRSLVRLQAVVPHTGAPAGGHRQRSTRLAEPGLPTMLIGLAVARCVQDHTALVISELAMRLRPPPRTSIIAFNRADQDFPLQIWSPEQGILGRVRFEAGH